MPHMPLVVLVVLALAALVIIPRIIAALLWLAVVYCFAAAAFNVPFPGFIPHP